MSLFVIRDMLFAGASDLVYPIGERILRFFFSELVLAALESSPFLHSLLRTHSPVLQKREPILKQTFIFYADIACLYVRIPLYGGPRFAGLV